MPQLHNVRIGSSSYRVEVANTPHLQQLGLSFRTHLSSNRGVLFVFPDEVTRTFHMRNMKFPLDIIFIGADKRVKWIIEDAQPDSERLISLRPSKYVLEVNAGDVKRKGIRVHSMLDTLNNPLIKQVSSESIGAKRKGLIPKTGDWEKPGRWILPEAQQSLGEPQKDIHSSVSGNFSDLSLSTRRGLIKDLSVGSNIKFRGVIYTKVDKLNWQPQGRPQKTSTANIVRWTNLPDFSLVLDEDRVEEIKEIKEDTSLEEAIQKITLDFLKTKISSDTNWWQGRCYLIAGYVAPLIPGSKLVVGDWAGKKGKFFAKEKGHVDHCWVELPDGRILDPTKWVFEGKKPYIFVGSDTNNYIKTSDSTPQYSDKGQRAREFRGVRKSSLDSLQGILEEHWLQKQDGGEGGFSGTAHTSEGTNTFTRTFGPSKDNKKPWTGKKKKNWARILTAAPDEEHITVSMLNEWLEKQKRGYHKHNGWEGHPVAVKEHDDYFLGVERGESTTPQVEDIPTEFDAEWEREKLSTGEFLSLKGTLPAEKSISNTTHMIRIRDEIADKPIDKNQEIALLEETIITARRMFNDPKNIDIIKISFPDTSVAGTTKDFMERWKNTDFPGHTNIVMTDKMKDVGMGTAGLGRKGVKVFWHPYSLEGQEETVTDMGIDPMRTLIHETTHTLQSTSEFEDFTPLIATIIHLKHGNKWNPKQVDRFITDFVLLSLYTISSGRKEKRLGQKSALALEFLEREVPGTIQSYLEQTVSPETSPETFSFVLSSLKSGKVPKHKEYYAAVEKDRKREGLALTARRNVDNFWNRHANLSDVEVREAHKNALLEAKEAGFEISEENIDAYPELDLRKGVGKLLEWIEKQDRDIPSEMRARGLEPQTGDWEHPYRWVRSIDSSTLSPIEKIHSIIESTPDLRHVLGSLSEVGQPYLVGGCVRDILIGKDCKDFDIEMYGVPQAELGEIIQSRFGGSAEQVGKQFGVFKVGDFDISLPRTETQTGEKHTDFDVVPDHTLDPMTAARRRDFTINAMMYDVKEGKILDFFGGEEDLSNGLIKHIDDETFVEDPLRVYRAAQFAARFGFNIDPATKELASQMDLSHLPRERVNEEFTKMLLKADNPSIGLDALAEMGVLKRYFPEIAVLDETPQRDDYHAEGDVFTHTKMVLDRAADVIKRFPSDKEKITIMLASLCHDLGKPATTEHHPDGSVSQHGHEEAGIDPTREFLSKLTRDTGVLEDVEFLVEHHLLPPNYFRSNTSDATFRKLINRYGMRRLKLLAAVSEADILGRLNRAEDGGTEEPDNEATEWFNMRLDEVAEKSNLTSEGTIKPLITGHDLKDLGFEEGRELGDILRDIKSHQETGKIADSSEALAYVKDTYMSKSLGDLVTWLFKAVSTESVSEAKRRGLVPQSGDWGKPKRWVRPEDAEKVPDSDVSDKREGASLVDGGVPANYGDKLYPVGKVNASLREFFDRDDVDVSLLQNMYSIGGELSKEFGISFRTVDVTVSDYDSPSGLAAPMPISSIEVDYQLDSKLPVPKKYAVGYMFTPKPMPREAYLQQTGILVEHNPSKESDYYTETIDRDLVRKASELVRTLNRNKDIESYTLDEIRTIIDKMIDFDYLPKEVERENIVSALKERFTNRDAEHLENPDHPYDEYVKHFMDNYAKEVFSEYHLGYQDTYSPDGEFMSEDPLAMDSPEQARQWVEEHGYLDEAGESIEEDFIIQETENIEAHFQKSQSHFARTINKYRDSDTGKVRFEVLHREMTLAEPYQNKGIATNINEHAEEVYAKLGIDRITLQANYDIGGYTWARQGYDFIHKNDRIALKQMFTSEVKRKHQRGDISDDELDSFLLDVNSLHRAWEFAGWNPTDEVDGKHFGKEFMLGSDWMAQKNLNPDSLGYKIGKLYYAGKNKKVSVTG